MSGSLALLGAFAVAVAAVPLIGRYGPRRRPPGWFDVGPRGRR